MHTTTIALYIIYSINLALYMYINIYNYIIIYIIYSTNIQAATLCVVHLGHSVKLSYIDCCTHMIIIAKSNS